MLLEGERVPGDTEVSCRVFRKDGPVSHQLPFEIGSVSLKHSVFCQPFVSRCRDALTKEKRGTGAVKRDDAHELHPPSSCVPDFGLSSCVLSQDWDGLCVPVAAPTMSRGLTVGKGYFILLSPCLDLHT